MYSSVGGKCGKVHYVSWTAFSMEKCTVYEWESVPTYKTNEWESVQHEAAKCTT